MSDYERHLRTDDLLALLKPEGERVHRDTPPPDASGKFRTVVSRVRVDGADPSGRAD